MSGLKAPTGWATTKPPDAFAHLPLRLGQRLSHLDGHRAGKLVGLCVEDIGEAVHEGCPLGEGRTPLGLERVVGESQALLDLGVGVGVGRPEPGERVESCRRPDAPPAAPCWLQGAAGCGVTRRTSLPGATG